MSVAQHARPPARGPSLVLAAALAGGLLVVFLALPLLALLARATPGELLAHARSPDVLAALRLSLLTSVAATAIIVVLGTPLGLLLATRDFRGRQAIEVLVDLPMVLPPTVAGFALLMAFGRAGLAGGALTAFGISLPFSTAAVVVAQVFMAAPFFVASARAGFAGVDRRLVEAASTLGASEWRVLLRVQLPLAAPAIAAGTAMAFARALGEFGATITFAGNLPGVTQTMPLAVYVAMQSDLDRAVVMSVLLVLTACGLLIGVRAMGGRPAWSPSRADRADRPFAS